LGTSAGSDVAEGPSLKSPVYSKDCWSFLANSMAEPKQ